MDIVFSSASALAGAIRTRQVSASEALDAHLAQIDRHNAALNAVVIRDDAAARQIRTGASLRSDLVRTSASHALVQSGLHAHQRTSESSRAIHPAEPMDDLNTIAGREGEVFVVELTQFSGPLDLLLTLIRDEQIDPTMMNESATRVWALLSQQAAENSAVLTSNMESLNTMNLNNEQISGCADFHHAPAKLSAIDLSTVRQERRLSRRSLSLIDTQRIVRVNTVVAQTVAVLDRERHPKRSSDPRRGAEATHRVADHRCFLLQTTDGGHSLLL